MMVVVVGLVDDELTVVVGFGVVIGFGVVVVVFEEWFEEMFAVDLVDWLDDFFTTAALVVWLDDLITTAALVDWLVD